MDFLILDAAPYRDPAAAMARRVLAELAVGTRDPGPGTRDPGNTVR